MAEEWYARITRIQEEQHISRKEAERVAYAEVKIERKKKANSLLQEANLAKIKEKN